MRRLLFSFVLLAAAFLSFSPALGQGRAVVLLELEGPLNPAMLEYLGRGLRHAERQEAEVVVVQLNTPGGSVDLMNKMVAELRASSTPVVVYVAPSGAMAGSAGTLITLAGHAAAMAPETVIGAASPVDASGQDLGETMEAKEKNVLKKTARGLAERRGEAAASLAEATIETAEAATAREALDAGLVDFIASDLEDLLRQLDGFRVSTSAGERILQTAGAPLEPLRASLIEQLLGILTNPNVVFLLITIGVQAILIEISSPGGWAAGAIGVVCLALATYGLGVLPVNLFGLVFLLLAFVLFLLDIKAPTHGALTAAGIAALIVGALVLFNSPSVPSFQRVSVPLVVFASLLTGALFLTVLIFALRAQRQPIRMGQESLAGRLGTARTDLDPAGIVQVAGESWSARLAEDEPTIPSGGRVQVVRVQGLILIVRAVR